MPFSGFLQLTNGYFGSSTTDESDVESPLFFAESYEDDESSAIAKFNGDIDANNEQELDVDSLMGDERGLGVLSFIEKKSRVDNPDVIST